MSIPIDVDYCRHHEDMSLSLIDYIIDEYNVDLQCHGIDPGMINQVKTMIKGEKPSPGNSSVPLFLWDLVANDKNALDVDKFDYLQRDGKQCNIELSTSFKRLPFIMKVPRKSSSLSMWSQSKEIVSVPDCLRMIVTPL